MTADPTPEPSADKRALKIARENAAYAKLNTALQSHPPLDGLLIEHCLRVAEERAVFAARLKGDAVVLKHFYGTEGVKQAELVQAELVSRYRIMKAGPLQVCKPVALLAGTGITLRAYQAGQRLDHILNTADDQTRAEKLQQAGAWLELYTQDRRSTGRFGPWKWIKQLNAPSASPHRHLIESLKVALRQQAPDLVGVPVQMSRTHGDFAALNLICDGAVMVGIDIENQHSLAIAKDMARFLAQAQSYRQPEATWMPVSDLTPFLSGFGPSFKPDQMPILRFSYGVELGKRLLSSALQPDGTKRLCAAVQAYITSPIDKPL